MPRAIGWIRRRWGLVLAVGILAVGVALVDMSVTQPRVTVRWQDGLGVERRSALEERFSLRNGEAIGEATWRYQIDDRSSENVRALLNDPAVADTGYIDRDAASVERPTVSVTVRPLSSLAPFPFSVDEGFPDLRRLFQIQSLWLLIAGMGLLWAARQRDPRVRVRTAIAALVLVGVTGLAFPISSTLVAMGDATFVTEDTQKFEAYAGVSRVRFEAHLSYVILGKLYLWMGADVPAAVAAQTILARAATVWFIACAFLVGAMERWSPAVLRYLGLSALAPASLLYFGWREFGYLAMNVATFPLVLRGARTGALWLETGGVLAGLGSALHGFGLVSMGGSMLAVVAAAGHWLLRLDRLFRFVAWAVAAYLGWVAIYVILLNLAVVTGHAEGIPWRPWFRDTVGDGRLNVAIFSIAGLRDLALTGWIVGAPLLLVAASLWRSHRDDVKVALAYSVPSVAFVVCFWPIQGLNEEMDLIVGAFPALYALTWVCAQEERQSVVAAWLLASAHLVFWRVLIDPRFNALLVGS